MFQVALALRAVPFGLRQIVNRAPTLQRLRQRLPAMTFRLRLGRRCLLSAPVLFSSLCGRRGFASLDQFGGEQEQLVLVHALALVPVAPAQQLLQPMLHLLQAPVLGIQLGKQTDHQLLQSRYVLRQIVGIDLHHCEA